MTRARRFSPVSGYPHTHRYALRGHAKQVDVKPAPSCTGKTAFNVFSGNHRSELALVWQNDPRVPSLASRRVWADARGIDPALVHAWFSRMRAKAIKHGKKPFTGTYDLSPVAPGDHVLSHHSTTVDDIKVKREYAASPTLREEPVPKRRKVDAGVVSRAFDAAERRHAPGMKIKLEKMDLPLSDVQTAAIRHTRTHDKTPHPACPICAQTLFASSTTSYLPLSSPPSEASSTPGLTTSALPSSDLDVDDLEPLTPIDSDDEAELVLSGSACRFLDVHCASSLLDLHELFASRHSGADLKMSEAHIRSPGTCIDFTSTHIPSLDVPHDLPENALDGPRPAACDTALPPRQRRKHATFLNSSVDVTATSRVDSGCNTSGSIPCSAAESVGAGLPDALSDSFGLTSNTNGPLADQIIPTQDKPSVDSGISDIALTETPLRPLVTDRFPLAHTRYASATPICSPSQASNGCSTQKIAPFISPEVALDHSSSVTVTGAELQISRTVAQMLLACSHVATSSPVSANVRVDIAENALLLKHEYREVQGLTQSQPVREDSDDEIEVPLADMIHLARRQAREPIAAPLAELKLLPKSPEGLRNQRLRKDRVDDRPIKDVTNMQVENRKPKRRGKGATSVKTEIPDTVLAKIPIASKRTEAAKKTRKPRVKKEQYAAPALTAEEPRSSAKTPQRPTAKMKASAKKTCQTKSGVSQAQTQNSAPAPVIYDPDSLSALVLRWQARPSQYLRRPPAPLRPPRPWTYAPAELTAFDEIVWDADGFQHMELSAIPWLACIEQVTHPLRISTTPQDMIDVQFEARMLCYTGIGMSMSIKDVLGIPDHINAELLDMNERLNTELGLEDRRFESSIRSAFTLC
ncbi:hypothetical protein OBBRIDRAFT_825759 [Obba rivulosa]|uniref:Uncharacterized protein n=1 Tax=Obba rivulosa TaxID=1052685 RepID=A0A8E2B235_9APHY|nr:hypothetical protein OBBRIDRAFT_825759 [Obba rivulosa]